MSSIKHKINQKVDKNRLMSYHTSSVRLHSNNTEVVIRLANKQYLTYLDYYNDCIRLHIPVYNEQCYNDFMN